MANYLNRPSIFEIATAFEDGKNGEIKHMINRQELTMFGIPRKKQKNFLIFLTTTDIME